MNINLQLTDDTELRAFGFVVDGTLFAEVCWNVLVPNSHLGDSTLWGTPAAMRRLAEVAIQAAIQAEEEACWHAHQTATTTAPKQGRVA